MTVSRSRRRRAPAGPAFDRLVRIMATLRSPTGCAWDQKQTHRSLRTHLLEETYEALDAIDRGDAGALREELGDVLLQVVFHAEMATGDGTFTINDVIDGIRDKLIRRHPHVFTSDGQPLTAAERRRQTATTPAAVKEQWQRIKARERKGVAKPTGVLAGLPRAVPALVGAYKIGGRVAAVGFDWPHTTDVVDKIEEEVRELREAIDQGEERTADEMGDLLFSIANLARKLNIDPESALRQANAKFTRRFAAVERRLAKNKRTVHEASLEEMEAAWNAIKHAVISTPSSSTSAPSSSGRRPRARRSR